MSLPRLFKKRSKTSFSEPTVKDPSPPLTSPPMIPLPSESFLIPQSAPSPPAAMASVSQVQSIDHQVSPSARTRDFTVPGSDSRTPVDALREGERNSIAGRDVSDERDTRDVAQPAQIQLSSVDTIMNSIDRKVSSIQQEISPLQSLVAPVEAMVKATGAVQAIRHQFSDATPVLMKALNEVAKLHPFIGVAVLAFKAVYTLDMKRRDNDQKVDTLRAEMKEMMAVLTQLGRLKNEEDIGPDNRTIKSRMEQLIFGAADDMQQCGNVCDAYMKKRLLTRVIKGPLWDVTLVDFVGRFEKRKNQFEFALSVHNGLAIDHANEKLDGLQDTTHDIMLRMDAMRESFKTMLTPIMKELDARIRQEGVSKVLKNGGLLRELNSLESKPNPLSSNSSDEPYGHGHTDSNTEYKDLWKELQESPKTAIERNFDIFKRKFEMQKKEIVEEIDKLVVRESDRVIESVLAGPHEKILDRELYTIWKDMGWRGNVKARHFVLALRDFFHEQLEAKKNFKAKIPTDTESSPTEKQDESTKSVGAMNEVKVEAQDDESLAATMPQVANTTEVELQPIMSTSDTDAGSEVAHDNLGLAGQFEQDTKPAAANSAPAQSERTVAQPTGSNPEKLSPNDAPTIPALPPPKAADVADIDDLAWTLEWITITRLQSIMEAFDDDGSGFISVAEANRLTTSRPHDWSLLHWLAYWAIGWQITATIYRDKINEILNKMASLRALAHPANRIAVDNYFREVWNPVAQTCMSFRSFYPNDSTLVTKFQSYMDAEEERIRKNLEEIKYDIDALDTLALITGPGRIEKHLFPLLYLLLKRDYEKMRLSRTLVLHDDELRDPCKTMVWLYNFALAYRCYYLRGIFEQQKVDVTQQFQIFAYGMFNFFYDSETHWSAEKLRQMEFTDYVYDDSVEAQDIDPKSILRYSYHTEYVFDSSVYDEPEEYIETEEDKKASEDVKGILGKWSGMLSQGGVYPSQFMMSITFHSSVGDGHAFEAKTFAVEGFDVVITGQCEWESDGRTCYAFKLHIDRWPDRTFRGYLDDATTLQGKWAESGDLVNSFILKRVSPEIMCCRPPPAAFEANRIQALWKFAITAVRDQVLKSRLPWSYLKKRRDDRKQVLPLLTKWPRTDEEAAIVTRIKQTLTTADARCYYWMARYLNRTRPTHWDVGCDVCENIIVGSRVVCIDCGVRTTIDLCDSPACLNAEVSVKKRMDLMAPHDSTHAVFKSPNLLSLRDYGKYTRAARDALSRAKAAFDDMAATMQDEASHQGTRTVDMLKKELKCTICKESVTRPCWCCAICKDNVFICERCDREQYWYFGRDIGLTGTHRETHVLVRCQEERKVEKALSVEQQMKTLNDRIDALQGSVDDKLDKMAQSLTGRMEKLEKLLELAISSQVYSNGIHIPADPRHLENPGPVKSRGNGHVVEP